MSFPEGNMTEDGPIDLRDGLVSLFDTRGVGEKATTFEAIFELAVID